MPPSTSRIRPPWLPPAGTYAARPAGKWWDAIQVDGASGWSALVFLAELAPDGTGPVLCEPDGLTLRMTFLVPPGTAVTWDVPRTEALGVTQFLTVPGDLDGDDASGMYWAAPPGVPEHVGPGLLRQALAATRGGSGMTLRPSTPGDSGEEPAANDVVLRPHVGMTIRTYRVHADGTREDFTATVVVPPSQAPAMTLNDWGPCRCPRCVQGLRPALEETPESGPA